MYKIRDTVEPHSLSQAISLLRASPDAVVVCGGTDILPKIRANMLAGVLLVRISGLDELKGINIRDDMLIIGAGETFSNISQSQTVSAHANALSIAASLVGGHEIRNVATIGGNLCNGAVSAESAAPLIALDALLQIVGDNYEKTISIHDFYLSPGKTALVRGEILKSICIPLSLDNSGSVYMKFGRRKAMEISTLGCAAAVTLSLDKRKLSSVHIALTLAGPIPLRCRKTEKILKGSDVTLSTIRSIGTLVKDEVAPRNSWRASKEFRTRVAKELSMRAVSAAVLLAGGEIDGSEF